MKRVPIKPPHGFGERAEGIAEKLRKDLGLSVFDPLDGFTLASHLDVAVYTPSELGLDLGGLGILRGTDGRKAEWSALTWRPEGMRRIIVHNCACAPCRMQSNMMHEIAHIVLNHEHENDHDEVLRSLPMLRTYNPVQEAEATRLGATLQLPRAAMISALKYGWTDEQIARHYKACMPMVAFRKRQSGAEKIMARKRA